MARSVISSFVTLAMTVGAVIPLAGTSSDQAVTITRQSGGSIRTPLGHGIVLNEGSTLDREFVAVHQTDLPADLQGTPGVRVVFKAGERFSSGRYEYATNFEIIAKEPLSAIEVRFLTFDIWGERGKSLTMTEVRDFPANTHVLDGGWNLFSENEASEYYASIAYISRVRTKDGRVVVADIEPVVAEARKFSAKFTAEDLEPEKLGKQEK